MRVAVLLVTTTLLVGCTSEPPVVMESAPPPNADSNFGRLSHAIAGIKPGEISLYEGLPSMFYEPQARANELKKQSTTEVHGHPFYEELLNLNEADATKLTGIFTAAGSFQKYRSDKQCNGFHADYCLEWSSAAGTTQALICLECGEVQIFGPQGQVYCDFSESVAKQVRDLLGHYSNNRPEPDTGS